MPMRDGWIDWAMRMPGIPDKVYSEPNRGLGLIGHSIVGSFEAAMGRFLSTQRGPDGRYTDYAAASCMFIARKTGELIQMYPVTASTWTSGGREANTAYWAIEAEGGPPGNESEPLTDAQVGTLLGLCREFEAHTGRQVVPGATFREHGEVARQYGYRATACPSNRYQRLYAMLAAEEEDDMTPEQVRVIVREVLDERLRAAEASMGMALGSTVEEALVALVRRQRAMGRATTVSDLIRANDPQHVP